MNPSQTLVFADLHLLTVLAQTRSYTQAARRLGVSKASVSMRIAELERAAGVPLVRRTTRSVVLTEVGLQLVADTQDPFERIAQSFSRVRDLAGSVRGLVRVTAPVALGRQYIAPSLGRFLQQQPEIRIELDLSDRLVHLAQEGFDLAIRHCHAPPDTHVAWALCPSQSVLVASPDYVRQRGAPSQPSDLAAHQCLLYLRDTASQSWSFVPTARSPRKGAKTAPPTPQLVTVTGPIKANNSEVLRDMVLGGLGVGLLPDFSAAVALHSGQLQRLMPGWRPEGFFGNHIFAIRPWSAQVPRAVQCLVDHLRRELAVGFPLPPAS